MEDVMKRIERRGILKGLCAGVATTVVPDHVLAQSVGPAAAAEIDVAKAKTEGRVLLYTSLDTKIVDGVIAPFKARYGIDVQYYRGGSNDVTSKVLAEADAGRIQVDMVDASDLASIMLMKDRGLLKAFKSPSAEAIAANLRDPDATWTADRLTQAIIQYNSKELAQKPPKAWKDLLALDGRLVFFSSPNGDGAPRLYNLAKHLGWDFLKGIAATKPLRVQTPQLLTQVLERGERAAGLLQNDNIAWRSRTEGKPTDFVFPEDGVPTEVGACGLLRASSRPHAAALFYEWWMGKEGQELLVKGGKYSSRNDIGPPKDMLPLARLKLLTLDYTAYRKERPKVLEQMTAIFGGEWGN
jgi:iron(III) transport system substrate-binding protein